MSAAVRAVFPTGTTATTAGGSLSVTTSVTIVAGDVLEVHTVFNGSNDAGITLSCKLDPAGANVSPDGSSIAVHSNGQTAGFEQVFYFLNPSAGTVNVTVTASAISSGWEQKCYAISGTDKAAPAITTFHPTGTGVTTAAAITSPTIPNGGIGISHFCAGSAFSSTGQTTQVKAQNGSATDAANAIAGASVAGTGSTVNMTATISGADWYAAIATAWAPAGTGSSGTVAAVSGVSGAVTAKHAISGTVAAVSVAREGADIGIKDTWFTDYNGNPQLVVNAEDWSVIANGGLNHSGSFTATYDDYLSTRAGQGYNQVYMSWCSFGSTQGTDGGRNGADSDGTNPFSTAMDPTTTPNSTFWSRRDYFLTAAAAQGITVLLNVTTPYLHQSSPNNPPQRAWSSTQWAAFGTFLGTRYGGYQRLRWILGDDYFDDINSNLNAFVTALRAAGGNQPLSIQYYQESSSRFDQHSDGGGATAMASVAQWNQGYSYGPWYRVVENMGNEASPIPYMAADGYFLTEFTPSPLSTQQLVRRMIWWALSSGSKGFTTGDDRVWPWASTSLAVLTSESFYTTVVPAIASYFTSLPNWHLLKADTSNFLVTAGRGTHFGGYSGDTFYGDGGTGGAGDSDNYVTASRTPDGSLAVIYMSKGATITIDQTKMGAGYTATWVDPKSCATSAATPGSTYNSTAKGNNSDGLNEWVLVLKANPVSGTVAAVSGVAGSTKANLPATGAAAGSSSSAGAVTARLLVAGAVAAASTVVGTVTANHPIGGTVAASSSVDGTPAALHQVAGTVAAVSGASGALAAAGTSGTAAASSGIAGSITVNTSAAGSAAAVSGVSGVLGPVNAAGTVAVSSSTVGAASLSVALQGAVQAVSGVSGSATPTGSSTGVVAATSGVSGFVTAQHPLAGSAVPTIGVAGSITASRQASGNVVALASLSGSATATYRITGIVHATSAASGNATAISASDGVPVPDARLTLTASQPRLSLTTSQPTLTLEDA